MIAQLVEQPAPPPSPSSGSHRNAWFFPALVIGLLTLQVTMCVFAAILANSDPTSSVEPDYYRKAVAWDDSARLRRASAALHWKAELSVSDEAALSGERRVLCRLHDSAGAPVEGASVTAEMFHHARASNRHTLIFGALPNGEYATLAPSTLPGLWEFRLTATHGADTYVDTILLDVPAAKRGGAVP